MPIPELTLSRKILLTAFLAAVIIGVGVADLATGSELSFSLFYLFPIAAAAWFVNRNVALLLSAISTISWYIADVLARSEPYSHPWIPVWNAGVRAIIFTIIAMLIAAMRQILFREQTSARIDYLTGAANSRAFYEAANAEIARLQRAQAPFSVLCLDADNLKTLNDTSGHSAGDQALRDTVALLRSLLRPSDTISRLGGDEFAILLSQTGEIAAEAVSTRIAAALRAELFPKYGITYSIGSLSCTAPPGSVDELIERADNIMYQAKSSGKNRIARATYSGAA